MKRKLSLVVAFVLIFVFAIVCMIGCNKQEPKQGDAGKDGKSAYELAVDKGYTGTEEEWLASLVGAKGDKGDTGAAGADGKSAYQLAVEKGYTGTESEWLASLAGANGKDGKSAYELAVENGYEGDLTSWLLSLVGQKGDKGDVGASGKDGLNGQDGVDGKSAYQIWLDNGNAGTEVDFLNWLKGKDGTNGTDGKDGVNGQNGQDGKDGVDGKSAYQIWLDNGNTGTEADFLNWLKGKDGTNGTDGKDGVNGQDGKDGNGVKSATINDKGELIITLDDGTVINAGQVVAPEKRIDENNQIICKTFKKTDKTIYGKVSNVTETFYFTDEIELKGEASYSVYKDFDCANEIVSKTVKLEVGDNTFYILEKCGNDSKFYTVTIRRRENYTVTFAISDGTPVENNTVKIEEDGLIPRDSIPSLPRDGYGLVWNFDFTKPVTENTDIVANWTAIYNLSSNSVTGFTDYGKTLSVLNIPAKIDGNSVTSIGDCAFRDCSGLTSIRIPDSVTYIGERAFEYCSGLTSIRIPDSVTYIGAYAFRVCSGLTSVIIGNNVTYIGWDAFSDCGGLKTVFYKGTAEQWSIIKIGYPNAPLTNATRYYYSETEPALNAEGTAYEGNFWHYDTDGITPVVWKKGN